MTIHELLFSRRRTVAATNQRGERGQALVMFAAGLAGFLGIAGMAIDIGHVAATRTDLQKTADAAALAAAQDLPNGTIATAKAGEYVGLNASHPSGHSVQITTTYGPGTDTITVTATRQVNYSFLKVVGLSGQTVTATATARIGVYKGGKGLLPWAFVAGPTIGNQMQANPCYNGLNADGTPNFDQNVTCTIKYGAGTNSGGDFGAVVLDAPGGNAYNNAIVNGSYAPYQVGDQLSGQTGNMQGPTSQGLTARLNSGSAACDTPAEAYQVNPDGTVTFLNGCESDPRVGVVPVVNQLINPQPSTIVGFAFIYIEGVVGNGQGNGQQQVKVRFLSFSTSLPGGIYQGTGNGPSIVTLTK